MSANSPDPAPLTVEARTASLTLTADNVRVAVTGNIYVAPVGAVAPTGANTALDPAWKALGYLSEDGISLTPSKVDTTSITAWQNSAEVRKTVTKIENTVEFTMIETNSATLEFFGSAVIDTGKKSWTFGGSGLGKKALIIDWIDGSNEHRLFIPQAEVTDRGSIEYKNGSPVGYKVTVSAYPDSSLGNLPFKEFASVALA